ncbi:MAG: winged helix-turn-helix transcriptional regulator [Candidatus Odinarchaeota archaeon]|nr:winged helix-turn-helix transcriptional regulator [Candidatus Odinarchaeota archaeon]
MAVNLSEADYEILRILQENARASISDISRKLGLSRVTVRQRIKKLIESGVIKKFTVILDDELFEQGVQVLIGFKAPDTEQLVEELGKMDVISEIYVTSGRKMLFVRR